MMHYVAYKHTIITNNEIINSIQKAFFFLFFLQIEELTAQHESSLEDLRTMHNMTMASLQEEHARTMRGLCVIH